MNTVQVWRITDRKYADTAFSGEGARVWGGRFNSPGIPAIYVSDTLSLALIEIIVQTNDRSNLKKKVLIRANIPENLIKVPSKSALPDGWNRIPASKDSQTYGDEWFRNGTNPVLKIPSVVVPIEYNYVINPAHKLFSTIEIAQAEPLSVDPRFFNS